MSFEYPGGLWSLLGVFVLIAVYLVRKKYDETKVASTYLWRLAQQMQKKRQRTQRLKRALLFVLQLFAVVFAGLLIAQPHMLLPGADTHYIAVIDGSGSMRIADTQGKTRFARALERIEHDAAALPWGSSVSVILASDQAQTAAARVYAGSALHAALESLQCGWGEGDLDKAAEMIKPLHSGKKAPAVCLYTDKEYEQIKGASVVNICAQDDWNVSLDALEAQGSIYGTEFAAQVISHGRDANVTFELYVNGQRQDEANVQMSVNGKEQTQSAVLCPAGEAVSVSVLVKQMYDYSDVRMVAVADDHLPQDNEQRIYQPEKKTARVLLAGKKTYFLAEALSGFERLDVTLASEAAPAEGYDLYVYDGCMPEQTPQDGAVMMINPPRAPRGSGMVFGETLMGAVLTPVRSLENPAYEALVSNLTLENAAAVRFREVTQAGDFAPVLLCGKYPVLLAGKTPAGYGQLIMPLNLQDTNLPLTADYVVLMHNMLRYTIPPMLDRLSYASGTVVYPQTLPSCSRLYLQTPDMRIAALEKSEAQDGVLLAVPGSYTLMQELESGTERMISVFVHMPQSESEVKAVKETQMLDMSITERDEEEIKNQSTEDSRYAELTRLLAAALLLVLMVEWVVYQREKY